MRGEALLARLMVLNVSYGYFRGAFKTLLRRIIYDRRALSLNMYIRTHCKLYNMPIVYVGQLRESIMVLLTCRPDDTYMVTLGVVFRVGDVVKSKIKWLCRYEITRFIVYTILVLSYSRFIQKTLWCSLC